MSSFGPPKGPQSNILAMTPQGQAMQAMRPSPTPMPKMAKGGSLSVQEMRKAIASASKSAGMKAPVVANRDLTDVNDFRQSLGDAVRERATNMRAAIKSTPFKYEPGQHVFTAHTSKNNLPPMQIVHKTLRGNAPAYRIRHEHGGDMMEYDIPESAIIGHLKAGGSTHDIQIEERPL